ncbi:MAG: GHMP kinase [Methanoculleus sp. SDB]|nr:MAG: GHMP kinase [Methanoculleus sp. SDB]
MPTLKIRGGDLDLVEYEFNPFFPGEEIWTPAPGKIYTLAPRKGTVTVTTPARIHLSVLDMNRFAPDHPGGGGIGFAIQVYCSADVTCTESEVLIDYSREPIIRHFVEVFKKAVGYTGGFRIVARDHEHKHVGLGSTGSILVSVVHGMNIAVGSPLSAEEIRMLIGKNYVEETADGRVTHGFETGVGPAAATFGGMAVMGDELALACHHPFAPEKNVYIVIPPTDVSSAGEHEFDLLMNRARTLDYRDRELKAYLILMDFIPALFRGDVAQMGNIIWEIEFRGSKRAEVEHHSFEIYHLMSRLRDAGLEFVGMSSVGPSIAIVTARSEPEIREILTPMGLTLALRTYVDNEGMQIRM